MTYDSPPTIDFMTEPAGPKYQAIAADLREKIAADIFQVGSLLPTKAELMTQYNVALNTVDRALDVLRDLGLVESRQGVGTFVLAREPATQEADFGVRIARLETQVAKLFEMLDRLPSVDGDGR